MSIMFQDSSHVEEIYGSDFKTLVNGLAKANETVRFRVNVQGGESVSISCVQAFAFEYITFMDALNSEIQEHGIAIVIAADYRPDTVENTIFVVCDDYFSSCVPMSCK